MPNALPAMTWGRTDAIINCAASLQLFTNAKGDPFQHQRRRHQGGPRLG